jgi:hypothetical protein
VIQRKGSKVVTEPGALFAMAEALFGVAHRRFFRGSAGSPSWEQASDEHRQKYVDEAKVMVVGGLAERVVRDGGDIEIFTEWRLTGQPPEGPPYDFTARTKEHVRQVKEIWEKATGRGWADVKLTRREVVIVKTSWVVVNESLDE